MMKVDNVDSFRQLFYKTLLTVILMSFCLFILGLMIGTIFIPFNQLTHLFSAIDADLHFVLKLRFQRELMALCCGGMLATGSAILQGLTRNPMVAPDLIGMTSMGCLFIIACTIFWHPSPLMNELLGIAGALLGFLLCVFLTNNSRHRLTILLIGLSISFSASAIIQLLVLRAPENIDTYLHFLTGSLYAINAESVAIVLIVATLAIPATFILSTRFSVFALDDLTCKSMGVPLHRYRIICFLVAALLIGSSIIGIGHLGFLGIVVPNIVRLIVGNRPRHIFPLCFLIGGLMYLLADTLGRLIISPAEIPAGMITNMISAPLFLYILLRYYRGQHEWN
jgi:ferric citrate transport system permease protein